MSIMRAKALFLLLAWAGAARPAALAAEAAQPALALRQLEAAERVSLSGDPEFFSEAAAAWADGPPAANRPALVVAGQGAGLPALASAAAVDPAQARRVPVPAQSQLADSREDGLYARLGQGFLEVETPALRLLKGSALSKLAGAVLFLALFIPAMIVGGVNAMF